MAPRVIALMGVPTVTENGEATEAITPGYLVEGVAGATIAKQTGDGVAVPMAFALERDELGKGIDDSLGVGEAGSADYAIGDTVKVGVFGKGDHVFAFIASGQNISLDEQLESAGDGTFEELGAGVALARSLDAVIATDPGDTRIRIEVL